MDIERLNKTQIILLTLLVSFVTSIATGIATVSLMEKAPTDVTRVISRIVEKPIETITPGDTQVVTQEHTVVVSESERIAKAIQVAAPSIVRMYLVTGKDLTFQGLGVIVSNDGVVVADRRIVVKHGKYTAKLSDGTQIPAVPSDSATEQGFFKLTPDDGAALPTLTPAVFAGFDSLALGQTVVAISGDASTRISPGIIAELTPTTAPTSASRLRASIDPTGIVLGSPLINLDGQIIGMPENAAGQIFLSLREKTAQ